MTLSAEPPLILVVDDDPGSRDVAARLLEREGYRTRQAESGDECLRGGTRFQIDDRDILHRQSVFLEEPGQREIRRRARRRGASRACTVA